MPTSADTKRFRVTHEISQEARHQLSDLVSSQEKRKKWILFVGRLQEQKNPIRLIDTFAEYKKKNKDAILIIIGDGNLRQNVKQYIRKTSLIKSVYMLGNLSQET